MSLTYRTPCIYQSLKKRFSVEDIFFVTAALSVASNERLNRLEEKVLLENRKTFAADLLQGREARS